MDEIKSLILLVGSGFLFRTALIYTGQAWAKSHAQTVSFLILPLITYVITNTIANNIALSLGMIGALSIVRIQTSSQKSTRINYVLCLNNCWYSN